MFFAAENDHEIAVAILLAYGADPSQTDSVTTWLSLMYKILLCLRIQDRDTAYDIAVKRGSEKVYKELLSLELNKQPTIKSISTQQAIAVSSTVMTV